MADRVRAALRRLDTLVISEAVATTDTLTARDDAIVLPALAVGLSGGVWYARLLRSSMLFASNATNFFAITFIPLAKTASISLMAPLLVVPLARLVLGERTTAGRLMGATWISFRKPNSRSQTMLMAEKMLVNSTLMPSTPAYMKVV